MTQPRINPARRRSKTRRGPGPATHYRVWIASYKDWAPQGDHDVPPDVVASEPAEPGTMSAAQAARYVEAFNRAALARHRQLWAVALPVTLHYEGDPVPGQPLPAARFRPARRPARKKARRMSVRRRHATGFHRGKNAQHLVRCPCQDAVGEAAAPNVLTRKP
jgi:hypothetical protein